MANLREPGLPGNLFRPVLDSLAFDLDAAAAVAARQMVVVSVRLASPVEDLTARVPDRVHAARLAEHLQVPVDGRQADLLAALSQLGVDLLSAAEPGQPVKHGGHRLGLPSAADPGAVRPFGGRALGETHNSHGTSRDGRLWPLARLRCAGAIGLWRLREDRDMADRLRNATSPYLLQHAGNPVDWWQWSDDAFAEARRRDVPVLLSVGYSACHWCHVMAHESFEDEATARLMNDLVVSIKVDREERPDVDAVYMTATQAMTGQGGWPMTVFLTPEREPFYCGTYYPRENFKQLVTAVAKAWRENRDAVADQAGKITAALAETAGQGPGGAAARWIGCRYRRTRRRSGRHARQAL